MRRAARLAVRAWVCAIACCSGPAPAPPGTVVVALESAPAVLDPRFATDANSSHVSALIARGLTAPTDHADVAPDLADWRRLGPHSYEFTLRAGARFHDGTPVTAADVAATYRSVLDPALRSPKREALATLRGIRIPDPRTVVFDLDRASAPFLDVTTLGILPARLTSAGPIAAADLVGCGPFRVAAVLDHGGVDLIPDPAWAGGPPAIARLRFKVVPDGVVRALELAHGTVHLTQNAVDPDLLPWLAAQPDLEVLIAPGTTFQYLGLNLRDPRLARRPVRRALAHAVDRAAIARHLLRDTARLATGLLPPSHWAYEADVATYEHDPARARSLLAASGVAMTRPFSYKTSTVELRRRIAEVFQADLARLGLRLDVRSYEWATFYDDVRRGNFELYALAWVGVRDPDVYFRIFHSSMTPPAGNNRGGYHNPRVDALLAEAQQVPERSARRRLYAEVQRILAEDLPIIPLWWSDNVVVKTRALTGFAPAADGSFRGLVDARFPSGGTASRRRAPNVEDRV